MNKLNLKKFFFILLFFIGLALLIYNIASDILKIYTYLDVFNKSDIELKESMSQAIKQVTIACTLLNTIIIIFFTFYSTIGIRLHFIKKRKYPLSKNKIVLLVFLLITTTIITLYYVISYIIKVANIQINNEIHKVLKTPLILLFEYSILLWTIINSFNYNRYSQTSLPH